MTTQPRVLISGASIAGPATAYWLHKYGFAVTVVEHAPGLRPGGFGVDIRGAALEVARRMSILDEVRAHDTRMQGTLFVDAQGKTQARMGDAAMGNKRGVDVEIMRDDLSRILYSLTEDKVRYVWGDSIKSLTETSNGVDVTFDHEQPQTFDLVIGADGMHSKVRVMAAGGVVESSAFKIGMRNFWMRVPGFMTLIFKLINRMVAKSANGIALKEY